MKAEFYIIPESFAYNSNLKVEEIEEKTKSLAADFVEIRKYKETNKLYVHPDIYNIKFINEITINELLFGSQTGLLDRDVRVSLQKIIADTETTTHTTEEVKIVLLPEHNEDICHGLIAFHPVPDIQAEFQIVYHIGGWLNFRRYFLSIYPKDPIYYVDECKKYFPNLYFHERNKKTINSILDDCSKKIIYHLSALNDNFRRAQQPNLHRSQVLEYFSRDSNLDASATLEGNASHKDNFTFTFINSENIEENVCCEPHIKLCYNDNYPGDSSYSTDRRIYFHEGKPKIHGGKILIGHIGNHL